MDDNFYHFDDVTNGISQLEYVNCGHFMMIMMMVMFIFQERLWESIREGVRDWNPRMAVEAVVLETQDGQHTLRSLLQGVDLVRDAHDLR